MARSHNFSAGPAILPVEVLERVQKELVDYKGTGSSIIELSHRGAEYTEVHNQAKQKLADILGLGDKFEVLFLQGGASTQFLMAPYNYLRQAETADYLNTGSWATKAIKEAKLFGNVHEAFSSKEQNFNRVPKQEEINYSGEANYVHFTSNNTIFGTQFKEEPRTDGTPLVCDASSDFLSRPIDVDKYGIIYAGAQKNAGPAGVTIVAIRKDMLEKAYTEGVPSMMSYQVHAKSLFNTPPVFAVYFFNYVLDWLNEKGGLDAMKEYNRKKAEKLYAEIDKDDFYNGTAEEASRSHMNVTFRLENEDLEKTFIQESSAAGLSGLKGHRSVGGMRASIYNACPEESIDALISFMQDFRNKHG